MRWIWDFLLYQWQIKGNFARVGRRKSLEQRIHCRTVCTNGRNPYNCGGGTIKLIREVDAGMSLGWYSVPNDNQHSTTPKYSQNVPWGVVSVCLELEADRKQITGTKQTPGPCTSSVSKRLSWALKILGARCVAVDRRIPVDNERECVRGNGGA